MQLRIRELRESKGLTQEELAAKSNISRATLWALETDDKKNVTVSTLQMIAKALEVPFSTLFFHEDD